MAESSDPFKRRLLDRTDLRLAPDAVRAIDKARPARPGHVSRNTGLTEAVQEMRAREAANTADPDEDLRHHG